MIIGLLLKIAKYYGNIEFFYYAAGIICVILRINAAFNDRFIR